MSENNVVRVSWWHVRCIDNQGWGNSQSDLSHATYLHVHKEQRLRTPEAVGNGPAEAVVVEIPVVIARKEDVIFVVCWSKNIIAWFYRKT